MLKIAILGNMNNNGTALLNYFRDAGCDAYLFPFFNDGKGSLKHFKPQNDISFDKTNIKFIVETKICNWPHQIMSAPFAKIYYFCYKIIKFISKKEILLAYCNTADIFSIFKAFDIIITSGYGPSILKKANINNYYFFPYTMGIEGIERSYAPSWFQIIARLGFEWARGKQIQALRNSKQNFIIDILAQKNCIRYQLPYKFSLLPLVYISNFNENKKEFKTYNIINSNNKTIINIFSFSRIIYTNKSIKKYNTVSKNSDWIFLSLKNCIDALAFKPSVKITMIEYGPDVLEFKKRLSILNLEEYFNWLPVMNRAEIFSILQNVDVCLGEFYQTKTLFGSAGYEALASGKPLVNGFNFLPHEFLDTFNIPEPPIIKISNMYDLENFFNLAINGKINFKNIGFSSKEWFEKYNSHGLVKLWINDFLAEIKPNKLI